MNESDRQNNRFSLGVRLLVLGVIVSGSVVAGIPNHAPVLKSPKVVRYNAHDRLSYRFSVCYSDVDRDLPATIQVFVDGRPFDLTCRKSAANGIYSSGRIALEPGVHKYYFVATDAQGSTTRSPRYGEWTGPYIASRRVSKTYNSDPQLSDGYVVQGDEGDIETKFTYSVHFRDADSVPPKSVDVIIDGFSHKMKLFKGRAWNGQYIFNTSLDTPPHGYYFRATDARGTQTTYPAEGFLYGPTVYDIPNTDPEITDIDVKPIIGAESDMFVYSVRYHDIDRDPPAVIRVIIDGQPHDMKFSHGKPYDGIYTYRTKLVSSYFHNYAVRAEDGRGGETMLPAYGTLHGPVVPNER